ncbi:anti-sigma factor family protein [Cohnella hongkongensis]|uniref:Anti-sigma-W factor RsiW n=1 Tax=Cohnella hongkongensis TaxID=178337 RepID=A0ABV9FBH3_9BACL
MELMQRYVDGDLDQQEQSLMMEHARQCSDCAAMLARLQKLSSELEQLPRVVPKFSIVDSILPELERLHAAGAVDGTDEGAAASASSPAPARSARPARLIRRMSGVIAAGVVVGLLLFGNPGQWLAPGGSHNASMPDSVAKQEAASGASLFSVPGAEDEMLMHDQSAEALEKRSIANESGQPEASMEARDFAPEEGQVGKQGEVDEQPVSGMSLTGGAVVSPDGKWRAVAAEEGTFRVYGIDNDELLYSSPPREGSVGLLTWSEDGTVLYFTVTGTDGRSSEWQLDMATFSESPR